MAGVMTSCWIAAWLNLDVQAAMLVASQGLQASAAMSKTLTMKHCCRYGKKGGPDLKLAVNYLMSGDR